MSDFGDWFKSLPLLTRYWLALTIGFSLLGRVGVFRYGDMILWHDLFIYKFQIWRPLTALFYYPITPATGFHFLINCYFLYNYSIRLETGVFNGRPAEYFFLLFFNWLSCTLLALLMNIPLLMDPMVLSVLYIWCNLNKDTIVSFWFGTRFKAMYLPWVLLAFNAVVAGGGIMELMGIIVGHLYFFLMYTYPQEMGGPQLISCPQLFYDWFPSAPRAQPAFRAPADPAGVAQRRHWGTGHVLGNN